MLSKNNKKEQIQKQEPKKQRFAIKKLTVGVASVLIGFTFMGLNNSANADTTPNAGGNGDASSDDAQSNANMTSTTAVLNTATTTASTAASQATPTSQSQAAPQMPVADAYEQIVASNAAKAESQVTTSNQAVSSAQAARLYGASFAQVPAATTSASQTQNVDNYSSFLNAVRDANIGTIQLTNDVDFSNANLNSKDIGGQNYENINDQGIARTITIDGQGHTLNFGDHYLNFNNANQSNGGGNWNITLSNMKLGATSSYGPLYFNGSAANNAKNTVTFRNVKTTQATQKLINASGVNVNFAGDNTFTLNFAGNNTDQSIYAKSLNVLDGTTTINATNQTKKSVTAIRIADGNVTVNGNANLNVNSNSANLAGITFDKGAGDQTIDNATNGVVRLMPTAAVKMNLGAGESMAIMRASHIDMQHDSTLDVNTKINTTGFRALAPIELDSTDGDVSDSTFRVGQNATLSVIRAGVAKSDSPLISMGPNDGNGPKEAYNFTVNGGSVMLKDSANSNRWPSSVTKGNYTIGWPGILTMWGTGSQNYITFNNAKKITLERTNPTTRGTYLIHTDAAGMDGTELSYIRINTPDSQTVTPLVVMDANGNTQLYGVKYLNNRSEGGDYAYGFRNSPTAVYQVGAPTMAGSVNDNAGGENEVILNALPGQEGSFEFNNNKVANGKASKALNSFINTFSWWNNNAGFGSDYQAKNFYKASYPETNVEQGKSVTVQLNFVEKDSKNKADVPEGTQFTMGADAPKWATIDASTGEVTLKPGTEVRVGAYNVPVHIAYPDASTETVYVPVVVTDATQTVVSGENGVVVVTANPNVAAHETTASSQVVSPNDAISIQSYELQSDGKIAKSTVDITPASVKASWATAPDTTVSEATLAGKKITGNVVNVDLSSNQTAVAILGNNAKEVSTPQFDILAKGAAAKDVKTPVTIQLDSDLTSDQFNQLVDSNIPASEVASTAWETKPTKGQGGVIKITFKDEANGQPTYLNITIPAKSLNVIGDDDTYQPMTKNIAVPEGTTPTASDAITNKATDKVPTGQKKLPAGSTIAWTDPSQVSANVKVPGTHTESITVTYPDGTKDTVTTNVTANVAPTTQAIVVAVNGTPDATKGITNLNNGKSTPQDGYPTSAQWTTTPDTTKTGVYNLPATVNYQIGDPAKTTIPLVVYNPVNQRVVSNEYGVVILTTTPSVYHWSSRGSILLPDVNSERYVYDDNGNLVSEALESHGTTSSWDPTDFDQVEPGASTATVKDKKVNIKVEINRGESSAIIGTAIVPTTVTLYGATPIEGKTAVHGLANTLPDPASLVDVTDLTAAHNSAIKDITWLVDEGRTIHEGKTVLAIPSVAKVGDVKTGVTIWFEDGTELDVPVTLTIVNNDADDNQPQTKDISTDKGTEPAAKTAITNQAKLPAGTTYEWTDPNQVKTDINNPGEHTESITVTYPDGTKDTVKTKVTVNEAPDVNSIPTKVGETPNPTKAITNLKDNVPGYPTKVEWKTAPDTKTPGNRSGVATVTYPDGTHKDVTISVTVDEVPQVKNISVKVGTTITPAETITNLKDNVPGYPTKVEWKTAPDTSKVGQQTGVITATYPDGTHIDANVPVTITDYANQYPVSYGPLNVERPTTTTSATNSVDPTTAKDMPAGAITGYKAGSYTAPTGVTVIVDPTTGKATAEVNKDAALGSVIVPVQVTYSDGTTMTVNVPVSVTGNERKGDDNIYYGDQSMTVFNDNLVNVHKTTADNELPAKDSQFQTITYYSDWDQTGNQESDYKTKTVYKLNADGTKYVNTKNSNDSFAADALNYSWQDGFAANTGIKNFTNGAADTPYILNGQVNPAEQDFISSTLRGNSKYRYNFSITDGTVLSKLGLSLRGYNSWANVYFNFAGATGRTDIPVNYNSAVPTTEADLENYLASNGISGKTFANGNPTGIKWVSMPGANGKFNATNMNGTLEFTFADNTTLEVPVSFKTGSHVPTSDSKTNDETNHYVTRTINFKAPAGEKAPETITQTVHYVRDGYHNVDAQGKDTSDITWNDWKLADGQTAEWAAQPVEKITDAKTGAVYTPQLDNKDITEVPGQSVTESTADAVITVTYAETTTPIKWDSTKNDMTKDVTRTITVDYPAGHENDAQPAPQVVHFSREDAKGNAGYIVNGVTKMNDWHAVGTDAWAEYTPTSIKGYTANPQKVEEVTVTPNTNPTTITITYNRNDDTPIKAGANDTKTITRTIVINYPAGHEGKQPAKQTISFTRADAKGNAGYTDAVTGAKKMNSWHVVGSDATTGTWAAQPVSIITDKSTGAVYTPQLDHKDITEVPAVTVTEATNDETVTVDYVETTTPIKWDGTKNDMTKDVTRTITVNYPAGVKGTQPAPQVVHFSREDAKGNAGYIVNGETKMNAWHIAGSDATTGTWTAYDAPKLTGYTADKGLDEVTVTPTTDSTSAEINYTANEQSAKINFVNNDDHNDIIGTQTVDGQTGETVKVTLNVPANWRVVPGTQVPSTITFGQDGVPTTTVYVEHQTENVDEGTTKTVTYQVIEDFNGKQTTVVNASAPFTRTATKDLVTNKVTYGAWTGNNVSIKETNVAQPGYTAYANNKVVENGVIPATVLTPKSDNQKIVVTYTANDQSAKINFVNAKDHSDIIATQTVNGKTGEKVKVTLNVPANWQIVSGQDVPVSIAFGATPIKDTTVYIDHQTKDVTNDPSQTDQTHRTVDYKVVEDFNGTKSDKFTTSATFTRTATLDLVTNKVTYGAWSSNKEVAAVNVAQPGYTAEVDGEALADNKVPATVLTPESKDQTIIVTYTANDQSAKINFVNNDDHNDIVGTQIVGGKTGKTVDITLDVPTGWQVVNGESVPSTITFGSEPTADMTVYVVHKTDTVDGRDDKNNTDVYRTVTRTITVNLPGEAPQSDAETLHFYRIKSTDEVTKKTTYTAWTSNMNNKATSFQEVKLPSIGGYTISATGATLVNHDGTEYVPAQSALQNGTPVESYTVEVNYAAQDQSVKINFVNAKDHSKVISTQTVAGKTGEKVDIKLDVPTNWKLSGDQKVPSSITFGSTPAKDMTVYIEHQTKDVTDDPSQKDQTHRTVNYKVVQDFNGTQTVAREAHLTFTRTATEDLVTGNVTYGKWSEDKEIPDTDVAIAGYTAHANGEVLANGVVPKMTITPNTKDQTIVVTYTANDQTAKINFVNNDNHDETVATQTINGKTGQTVNVNLDVPAGWEVVAGTDVPATISFGSTPVADTTVYVQHKVDKEDGRNDKNNTNLYRQVTRTIVVNLPGQPAQSVSETLDFYRIKSTDEVTKTVTYTPWTSNMTDGSTSFEAVSVPTIGGYTTSATGAAIITRDGQEFVPAESGLLNGAPINDFTVTVNYTANDQSAKINYVDANDHSKVISTQTVTGKTGETVKVTLDVPANWKLAGNQQVPSTIAFGSTPTKDMTVYVEHQTKDVTNDPSQMDQTHRTISYKVIQDFKGSQTVRYSTAARFVRNATEDLVTGDVTYGKWSANTDIAAVGVAIAGYTAQVNGKDLVNNEVPAITLTPESHDTTVTVTYVANDQSAKINFVNNDNHNDIVGTQTVTGQTGETVKVDLAIPAGWQVVSGTNVPSTITFGSTPVSATTVYVVHKVDTNDGRNDKSNSDLYRQVTRTITVNLPGQTPQTVHETLDFYRIKSTDEVTKKTTYTNWTSNMQNGATAFSEVEVPMVGGYTMTATGATLENINGKEYVPAQSALQDGTPVKNYTVEVNYTANDQSAKINFVNANDHSQVVASQTVTGKTGETAKVSLNVPANWQLVGGQQVPSSITFGSTPAKNITVYVEHKTENIPVNKNNSDTYRAITQTINVVPAGQQDTKPARTVTVEFQRTGVKDLVTGKTTWNAWQGPQGAKVENGVTTYLIKGYDIQQVKGYDSYVNGTKATSIAALTVNPDSQNVTDTITYAKGAVTPVPFDPTNSDMYREVTRTINVTDPVTGETKTSTQTAKFTREDAKGNAGYTDPVTGKTTMNPWTPAKQGLPAVHINPIKGYTTVISGDAGAIVVTPDSKGTTVTVSYNANKPTSHDITVNKGATPDPATAITNKDDLPTGTTYTWQATPDTETVGTHPAVVVVTYPSGDKTTVSVNVTVKDDTPTPTITDADKYTPSYPEVVTTPGKTTTTNVKYDGEKPTGDVSYKITDGANVPSWVTVDPSTGTITTKTPADGTTQVVTIPVTVTYPDKTTDKTTATVVIVATKDHVDHPANPQDTIKDPENLPAGTKVTWTPGEEPDPNKKGDQPTSVTVTVPGQDPVKVPTVVNYGNPTDADKYVPKGKPVGTTQNVIPEASEGIANKSDLPGDTTYTWNDPAKITQDVKTPGTHTEVITVNYPDGSKNTVTVKVTVKENVTPHGNDDTKVAPVGKDITVNKGEAVPDPSTVIANKGELPSDTKYEWQTTPDTNKTGKQNATVVVTYPDGTDKTVTITITVVSDADKYEPQTQPITDPTGVVPDPAEGIKNKADLPGDTKYTWSNPAKVAQDVKTAGDHTETVVVTYPDGSKDTIDVTVHSVTPQGQNISTPQGKLPTPDQGIANKDEMPAGTKYGWKQQPDVTTAGDHTGVIEVTFPDGSKYDVTVTVHVDSNKTAENTDNNSGVTTETASDSNAGKAENTATTQSGNNSAATKTSGKTATTVKTVKTQAANSSKSEKQANDKKLPQTGNKDGETSALVGLGLASATGLLGASGLRKKKEDTDK
ncbi:YSIRK-type signal peptide-containing protein [Limosilactobacillus sp. STM2_1]|uniref:YSIRK-type signal peptide-containing protein n=1 Tax=Limosilactobacillus rudii TaxID=2759755 RepID=A0A7W3UK98_9LACO|nr:Rib/alpha-like domain-containing protein [Limosilactobacillus rudii]MBB1078355.1 YSIRK-type signal peptide-containing protein [Limosilactobacillus rudii]MBB1096485.1 YSIRK-type signal peptide-containing protein [Limosilactobacillus rudii]MCD7134319.1 YPDG domain-containing protein [Limosilactobacillus rudii]